MTLNIQTTEFLFIRVDNYRDTCVSEGLFQGERHPVASIVRAAVAVNYQSRHNFALRG